MEEKYIQLSIAVFLAYIAWQTYKINKTNSSVSKDQLRLNLFDRRYKVFEAFRTFLSDFMITARIENADLSKFILNTTGSFFLFEEDIVIYRVEIQEKAIRHKQVLSMLDRGVQDDDKRSRLAEEAAELEMWFGEQYSKVGEVFRKYLHFPVHTNLG